MATPRPEVPDRRQRKRDRTLDHIARTALRLFEALGYDAVTMEQVAAEADIARRTLYNHFPVKEAILAYSIHAQLAADLVLLGPAIARHRTLASRLSHLLDASADWCEAHRAYLPPYLRFRLTGSDGRAGGEAGDMVGAFALLIDEAQSTGELRGDLVASHLAVLLHHLYFGALMRWLADPSLVLRGEFAVALDLFLHGAARSPAPVSG